MRDKCDYRAANARSQAVRPAAIFTVVRLTTGAWDNLPGTRAATAPPRFLIQGLNKSQYANSCVYMGGYCVVWVFPGSLGSFALSSERRLAGSAVVGVHSR